MSKPYGLGIGLSESAVTLSVIRPSRAEDLLWDAVREAVTAGWSPERFRSEVASAWEEALKDDAKDAREVFK
jgi:hypothetical protein